MSSHFSDELPRLLTGEAPRDVVLDAAVHLRTCVDCQQELVSAVVAHASLSSAHRFAPEVVTTPSADAAAEPVTPLPDMSAIFAQVREEAASPLRRPRSRRSQYLLGAAAAAVVIGASAAAIVTTSGDDAPTGRTVALTAFDTGHVNASATLTGSQMRIDASALPRLTGKHYEVWLVNDGGTKVPVGWIDPDGKASIGVPENIMDDYSAIVVSVQDDGSYVYSGTSVLRGDYA